MKPTSQPPPETLSDEECDALRKEAWRQRFGMVAGVDVTDKVWDAVNKVLTETREAERVLVRLIHSRAYAAGYEARGKRDAEIARTEVPGDMCGDLIAAAIESSSCERRGDGGKQDDTI